MDYEQLFESVHRRGMSQSIRNIAFYDEFLRTGRLIMPIPGEEPQPVQSPGAAIMQSTYGLDDYLRSPFFTGPRALLDNIPVSGMPVATPNTTGIPRKPLSDEQPESLTGMLGRGADLAGEALGQLGMATANYATEALGNVLGYFGDAMSNPGSTAEAKVLGSMMKLSGLDRAMHDVLKASKQAYAASRMATHDALVKEGFSEDVIKTTLTGTDIAGSLLGSALVAGGADFSLSLGLRALPALAGRPIMRAGVSGALSGQLIMPEDAEVFSANFSDGFWSGMGDFLGSRVGSGLFGGATGALATALGIHIAAKRVNRARQVPAPAQQPLPTSLGSTTTTAPTAPGNIATGSAGSQSPTVAALTRFTGQNTEAVFSGPQAPQYLGGADIDVPFSPLTASEEVVGAYGPFPNLDPSLGPVDPWANLMGPEPARPPVATNLELDIRATDSPALSLVELQHTPTEIVEVPAAQRPSAPAPVATTGGEPQPLDFVDNQPRATAPASDTEIRVVQPTPDPDAEIPAVTSAQVGVRPETILSTDSRSFVARIGTTITDADGQPLMLFRGGNETWDELSARTGMKWQVAGEPAFYATPDYRVAGGDPADIVPRGDGSLPLFEDGSGRVSYASQAAARSQQVLDDLTAARAQLEQRLLGGNDPQAAAVELRIAAIDRELARRRGPSPNVIPFYAAAQNVLDFDGPLPEAALMPIKAALADLRPDMADAIDQFVYRPNYAGARGARWFYDDVSKLLNETNERTGRTLNTALVNSGYDAIKFDGSLGSMEPHDVYAILDKRIMVPAYSMDESIAEGVAAYRSTEMSKRARLMESQRTPSLALAGDLDDADVALATYYTDTNAAQVVRNVDNPELFAAKMQDLLPQRYTTIYTDPVTKQTNALITGSPIQGRRLTELNTYGVAKDMVIEQLLPDGTTQLRVVTGIKEGKNGPYMELRRLGEGPDGKPWNKSNLGIDKRDKWVLRTQYPEFDLGAQPELWDDFSTFMEGWYGALQLDTKTPINAFTDDGVQFLPQVVTDYLDASGIFDVGQRSLVIAALDNELTAIYRRSVPEELLNDLQRMSQADANAAFTELAEADAFGRAYPLDDKTVYNWAYSRGYQAIPDHSNGGWILKDQNSADVIKVQDSPAALAAMQNLEPQQVSAVPEGAFPVEAVPETVDAIRVTATDAPDYAPETVLESIAAAEAEELAALPVPTLAPAITATITPPVAPPLSPTAAVVTAGVPAPVRTTQVAGAPPRVPPTPPPTAAAASAPQPQPQGGMIQLPTGQLVTQSQINAMNNRFLQARAGVMRKFESVFDPLRSVFSDIQEVLTQGNIVGASPLNDYARLTQRLNIATAKAEPALRLLDVVDRNTDAVYKRNGQTARALFATNPAARTGPAGAAAAEYENIARILFGNNFNRMWPEIQTFMQRLQTLHAQGHLNPTSVERAAAGLNNIDWLAQHLKRRPFDARVVNPSGFMDMLTHSYTFHTYAGQTFKQTKDYWRSLANFTDPNGNRLFTPVAETVLEWLDVVELGYVPGKGDMLVNAIQNLSRGALTEGEAKQVLRGLSTSFSKGVIGWRIAPLIRDSMQIGEAIPFVGPTQVARAYTDFARLQLTNQSTLTALVNQMKNKGMLVVEAPRFDATVEFAASQASQTLTPFTPGQQAVRNAASRILAAAENTTPTFIKWLSDNGLRPYGAVGFINRAVTSIASVRHFDDLLTKIDPTIYAGTDPFIKPIAPTARVNAAVIDDLLDDLNVWETGERQNIGALLRTGNIEDARTQYVNMVTDKSQYRYGPRHAGTINRTVTGSILSKFGTYSFAQYRQVRDATRILLRAPTSNGAPDILSNIFNRRTAKQLRFAGSKLAVIGTIALGVNKLRETFGVDLTGWIPLEGEVEGIRRAASAANQLAGQPFDIDPNAQIGRGRPTIPYLDQLMTNPIADMAGIGSAIETIEGVRTAGVIESVRQGGAGGMLGAITRVTPYGGIADFAATMAENAIYSENNAADAAKYFLANTRRRNHTATTEDAAQRDSILRAAIRDAGNGAQ